MEECRACYLEEVVPKLRWWTLLGRWLGDELAFGIVGGRRKLGVLPKPDHMHWPEEFATLSLTRPKKPLLHMIWPPEPETFEALLRQADDRRRRAAVPTVDGAHWRQELRHLSRLSRRRRFRG